MNPRILVLALLPLMASAELLTVGIQGGVPAQTPLGRTDSKMPFVAGPSVDVHIFKGLTFETGVLYQRLGGRFDNFTFSGPPNTLTFANITTRASAWEIPVLAKYRFLSESRSWRPFLVAGPSLRRTSITTQNSQATTTTGAPTTGSFSNTTTTQWNIDPTVGVGMDAHVGHAHIEPEVRYSYWNSGKTGTILKNQVNVLIGLRF